MSKFKLEYSEYGTYSLCYSEEVDPADYLECEDEDLLRDYVWDDISTAAREGGYANLDCEESEFKLPDEFISVWRHLKEMKEQL